MIFAGFVWVLGFFFRLCYLYSFIYSVSTQGSFSIWISRQIFSPCFLGSFVCMCVGLI